MPSFIKYARLCKSENAKKIYVRDALFELNVDYSLERAERIGRAEGLSICAVGEAKQKLSNKTLKAFEKEIDSILSEYLDTPTCVLRELLSAERLDDLENEKSIHLRIRRKGMLCQTAMWFESYNLVLV